MKLFNLLTPMLLLLSFIFAPASAQIQPTNNYLGPIASDKLFTPSNLSNLQFSPNGEMVALLEYQNGRRNISFIETKSQILSKGIEYPNHTTVLEYFWLDNHHLYAKMKINRRIVPMFISITNTHQSWLTNPPRATYKKATTDGAIVGILDAQSSDVIFAQYDKNGHVEQLSVVKVPDLVAGDLSRAKPINHLLSNVNTYTYDANFNRLTALQINQEDTSVTISSRGFEDDKWQQIYYYQTPSEQQNQQQQQEIQISIQAYLTESTIAVLTNYNSDKVVVYEYDLLSQQFTQLLYEHPQYDVVKAEVNTNNNQLSSIQYYDHGKLKTEYFDNQSAQQYKSLNQAFKGLQISVVDKTASGEHYILRTSNASSIGRYYFYNNQSKEANLIAPQYTSLEHYKFGPTQTLMIDVGDDIKIEAYLTQPMDRSHNTLLVMPHGGPIGVREYNDFNPEVQYYASRGFSVLRVNFRGSAGFGQSFQQSGVGQFGQQIEQDISAAVNQVRSLYKFKHMCAMGASYGGYSSLMLAIKHPQLYDCVVGAFGIYDLPYLYNASNIDVLDEMRQSVSQIVGEYNDKLYQVSPVYLIDQIKTPVLLIAGKNDQIAHFEHTARMNLMLTTANKPVEQLYYDNTGHGHKTYWGDRHEAALTADYLMRTLKLPHLWPAQNGQNQTATEAIAADYRILNHGYAYSNNVPDDTEKAQYYGQLALKLGDMNAIFEKSLNTLSVLNLSSPTLKAEAQTAIEQLTLASDMGLAEASLSLAYNYDQGTYVTKDDNLYGHFTRLAYQQADKQKDVVSYIYMRTNLAWSLCVGMGNSKNIDRCYKLLSHEQVQKDGITLTTRIKKLLNETITDVLINHDGKLTPNELVLFRQLLIKQLNTSAQPLTINLKQCPTKSVRIDEPVIIENHKKIAICFNIARSDFNNKDKETVTVLARVTSTPKNKRLLLKQYDVLTSANRKNWRYSYVFDEIDFIDGDWTIELFDILGNPIHKQDFKAVYNP